MSLFFICTPLLSRCFALHWAVRLVCGLALPHRSELPASALLPTELRFGFVHLQVERLILLHLLDHREPVSA